ncbi:MAG: uroporphyrinogen decarboxylase [Alphaproteobacteria bacterium]|jgi:uroporphyrinogen decarboxylase|nr:uroporphyrinogen decarboxylase [Alphaproteobacteria bacterium]
MAARGTPKLIRTLGGEIHKRPPVWMMRQAGRHLPEYLELRSRARDFLDFCYTPSMAAEATLQPVKRYGMDGAILFADILLILDAMGRGVRFEKGIGPIVETIGGPGDLDTVPLSAVADRLAPVSETVSRVKSQLSPATSLIGFAGAPWTVLIYAIEGRGKTDKNEARSWVYTRPDDLGRALELMSEATARYMLAQAEAGADALMIFDSWAEGLADDVFRKIIISPTARLVSRLRELGVTLPIIGFPRGAGAMLAEYADQTGVSAVGLDTSAVPAHVNASLPADFPVQGHLDPLLLRAGGEQLVARTREIVAAYRGRPHIFNLGHGVLPDTPISNVETVVSCLRDG